MPTAIILGNETEENGEIRMFLAIGLPNRIDRDLKSRLQEKTGILSKEIEKRKSSIGAPMFYHKQKLLTKSCSISHHGNYGAYAFTVEYES